MNSFARSALVIATLAWLWSPSPATAQVLGLDLDLRITPRAGVLTPPDWFYEEFKRFGASPLQWTQGAIKSAPLVGATVELEVAGNGLWLRGEVLRTLDGETSVKHSVYTPPSTAGPAEVTQYRNVIPSSVTIGSFDIGLPTAFRLPLGVQPYVTAGIGGKTYGFDISSLEEFEDSMVLPRDGTTLMYNVGVGAVFTLLGVDFDLVVRDAISDYWEKQQHDIMVLGGASWRVF